MLLPTLYRTQGQAYCHRFPARAVERFTGPFNHNLSYPILVIGNKVFITFHLAKALLKCGGRQIPLRHLRGPKGLQKHWAAVHTLSSKMD